MAQETGLPPKVLKYSIPVTKEEAISVVVTTAAIGWPLPIGLPRVTMSGTTSWLSKAQKWVPTRPKPTWTSSAMTPRRQHERHRRRLIDNPAAG